jgi:phospho-N-acetylmuramoyl-pentapeptide-transferase
MDEIKPMIIVFWALLAGALIMGPIYIPLLKRLKFGQTEREDGPQSHLSKAGTPTIGGLIFLTPVFIGSLVLYFTGLAEKILPLLFVTIGFAAVGFLDDFLKIVRHNKDGLKPWKKMGCLLIVSVIFSAYVAFSGDYGTQIAIDFFGLHTTLNMAWLFIPFSVFILLAMTNAVNLTDGVDGLCGGCSLFVFFLFMVITLSESTNLSVSYFSVCFIGSLVGFLFFNYHPAKVFMGDTGSLALGGAMGACAILMQKPLILILAGLLFVIEALSDIIQVAYFKKTGGKRFFKMAPIHHHFELCGWSEVKVVWVFWGFTVLCCAIAGLCVLL